HAEAGARRVDERAIEAALVELAHVGVDDAHVVRAEAADVLLELARPTGVDLDGGDGAPKHRRLAARRGAGVEHALALRRVDDERGELRAAALRPDPPGREQAGVDPLHAVGAGNIGRLADGLGGAYD